MAPITLQRFIAELDKLRRETDAGMLKEQDYDAPLARIIRELRERGLDADRAVATAAVADALKRGVTPAPLRAHLRSPPGLLDPAGPILVREGPGVTPLEKTLSH